MPLRFVDNISEAAAANVIVIGGGVVGLATACMLSRRGLTPAVVDAKARPCTLASSRSGEGARAQWELTHNISLARDSIALYADFGAAIGIEAHDAGWQPNGYFYGSRDEAGAAGLERRVARQRAAGLDDVEYLAGDEVRRRFPLLAPDIVGASFRSGDGIVSVDRIIAGYLAASSGYFVGNAPVTDIQALPGGISVETALGTLTAPAAVIASGAGAAPLLRMCGADLKLRNARASIVRLKVGGVPPRYPAVVDTDVGSFWRPDVDGARITASFSGTLFVPEGIDDPEIEPGYVERAFATASRMTPFWTEKSRQAHDIQVRSGTFAVTTDGAPIFGPLPGVPGLFVNIGYDGHGVMCSIEGARRLAGLMAGDAEHDPKDPFAAERFLDGSNPIPEPMTIHQVQ